MTPCMELLLQVCSVDFPVPMSLHHWNSSSEFVMARDSVKNFAGYESLAEGHLDLKGVYSICFP